MASVTNQRRIVFGVTVSQSLALLGDLPEVLAAQGWDVHLISSGGRELEQLGLVSGVTSHPIQIRREPHVFRDFLTLIGVTLLINRIRPDIVAFATPKSSLVGMLASFLAGVPKRVYLLWGLRLETVSGLNLLLLRLVERLTSSLSTDVVSVSDSLRSAYVRGGYAPPEKVKVIGGGSSRGVDLDHFKPKTSYEQRLLQQRADEIGLLPGVPVIGFFGRMSLDKGIEVLIDALNSDLLENLRFQLLLVGENEVGARLSALLDQTRFPVVHIPRVPDLSIYFHLLDLFCFPTFREGMPNVVLEALAAKVPVITTDATGAVDAVEHGVSGLIVNKNSSNALASAVAALLQDERQMHDLAANSRDWVADRFDSWKVLYGYEQFLNRLL